MSDNNYYIINRKFITKAVQNQMIYVKKILKLEYLDHEADSIVEETNSEFEIILPQIPYIGGKENLLTKQLVGVTPYLALYRVMKRRGVSVETVGKIVYDSSSVLWGSYPTIIKMFIRMYFKSKNYYKKTLCIGATNSQKKKYPFDFVFSAVKGKGNDFDYGVNYTECGICKFFHAQDADELTPYMCLIDYAQCDALDLGLTRTKTIAHGDSICDFRYKIGKKIKRDYSQLLHKSTIK